MYADSSLLSLSNTQPTLASNTSRLFTRSKLLPPKTVQGIINLKDNINHNKMITVSDYLTEHVQRVRSPWVAKICNT